MGRPKAFRNKDTVQEYIDKMKDPRFTFSPVGTWNWVHGDGKSRTHGAFLAYTQATSADPPVYRVKVTNAINNAVVIGPIELEPQPDNMPPLDVDVLNALREAIGLQPM